MKCGQQGVDVIFLVLETGEQREVAVLGLALFAPSLHGETADVASFPLVRIAEFLHANRGCEKRVHLRGCARMKIRCCSTNPLEVFILGET